MFYLKQYDTELLSFEIDDMPLEGQKCRIVSVNEQSKTLFPIGMNPDNESLMKWLRGRVIPKNREYVDALLAKNGLAHGDTRGILRISRGLSLNDSYWITEDGFDETYRDCNLYEHVFDRSQSLLAFTGAGSIHTKGFSYSPEFSTGGMLRKGWRRINRKVILYKGGTNGAANAGNEPYSEYYASQIAEQMGIRHVSYQLSMWKHCLCSTCELFCDINTSYVPIYRFMDNYSLPVVAEYLKQLGEDFYSDFVDMLIFDCLIYNEDRHFGNFGLMVDNHTNKPVSFAPVFDHGLSLFNYAMPDQFNDLDSYAETRLSAYGISFDAIAKEFITARQKEKLRKMIGFRFVRHPHYNLPSYRLKAIERHLQKRLHQLLQMNP